MSFIWTIIIGLVAGVIAKFLYPGKKYEPSGFILTTVLGIVGAFVATYLGPVKLISSIANPCCNRVLIGIVVDLRGGNAALAR